MVLHFGRARRLFAQLLGLILLAFLTGCSGPYGSHPDNNYVFVYLKSGPNSGQGDKETRQKMFAGHMGNIQRLADDGALVIAGPFAKPTDKTWRGILVFGVKEPEQAMALAASDPGVQASEFVPVAQRMQATRDLRRTMEFEKEMKIELEAKPSEPGQPPQNIRGYVMLTCEDDTRAWTAVKNSAWRKAVVWYGRFTGTRRGVIVLDATDAEQVRASLKDVGECSIDGWWSTVSLMRLRESPHSLAEPTEQ